MRHPSELELFLRVHTAEGELNSQGEFTIAREQALRKISEFQLPFECAWAVKLVQAIVAGGSSKPIRVDLNSSAIHYHFLEPGFTLDELEVAFYNPEPSPNRSLRHLLSALWAVGLQRQWGFQVAFPQDPTTLIWDGLTLKQVPSEAKRNCVTLSIAPLQQKKTLSWMTGMVQSGRRNLDIQRALTNNCYVCPIPLTVDGQRVDLLQSAQYQGWSATTYPLTIGKAEAASLPRFGIPPKTFDSPRHPVDQLRTEGSGGGWLSVSRNRLKSLTAFSQASIAYIVSIHMQLIRRQKSNTWESDVALSQVYWVLDGALVGDEPLLSKPSHCSVGCFLSAEGLDTDFTTLNLLESPERKQRLARAREALSQSLASFDTSDFESIERRSKLMGRAVGTAIVVGSACLTAFEPFHGLMGLVTGCIFFVGAGSDETRRVKTGRESILDLRDALVKESSQAPLTRAQAASQHPRDKRDRPGRDGERLVWSPRDRAASSESSRS